MDNLIIYHNGACSKCRGALELLQQLGVPHTVRWYIAEPLTEQELRTLQGKLGMPASQLVRTGEELYKQHYEGRKMSEEEWLAALIQHPELMQRPIAELGDRAIVARPPEAVLDFLGLPSIAS
jgi:arsenate reductase (glutaredoxin)